MKSTYKILLLAALLFVHGPAAYAMGNLKVVVYGDSIISGEQLQDNENYAAKLGYKLREMGYTNVDVINMSTGAQTTSSAAEGIMDLLSKRPDVVVLQLGNNEMLRGVNTDIIYKNLINIIGKLQQNGIYVVLLGVKAPDSIGYAYAKQMEEVFSRVVTFYRISFYPNIMENISGNPDLTLADGYYPNSKAIDYMVEATYLMVDEGLRWKWKVLSEQQGGVDETKEKMALPPPMPSNVEPPPQTPHNK